MRHLILLYLGILVPNLAIGAGNFNTALDAQQCIVQKGGCIDSTLESIYGPALAFTYESEGAGIEKSLSELVLMKSLLPIKDQIEDLMRLPNIKPEFADLLSVRARVIDSETGHTVDLTYDPSYKDSFYGTFSLETVKGLSENSTIQAWVTLDAQLPQLRFVVPHPSRLRAALGSDKSVAGKFLDLAEDIWLDDLMFVRSGASSRFLDDNQTIAAIYLWLVNYKGEEIATEFNGEHLKLNWFISGTLGCHVAEEACKGFLGKAELKKNQELLDKLFDGQDPTPQWPRVVTDNKSGFQLRNFKGVERVVSAELVPKQVVEWKTNFLGQKYLARRYSFPSRKQIEKMKATHGLSELLLLNDLYKTEFYIDGQLFGTVFGETEFQLESKIYYQLNYPEIQDALARSETKQLLVKQVWKDNQGVFTLDAHVEAIEGVGQ